MTGARSFDETASTYAAARPAYPIEAVAWSVPPTAERVLDLGAGTGKLTRQLVDAGHQVVAVEPSPEMGAELSACVPEAELLVGTAEDIPLPDADMDAVVSGSAFPWFDEERAVAEVARVLRPGGTWALLWNRPDERTSWVRELGLLTGARERRATRRVTPGPSPYFTGWFTDPEQRDFPHVHSVTGDSLLELLQTFSYYLLRDADGRRELLAAVSELLDSHPDLTGHTSFSLPYVTPCWRATRR